MVRTGRRRRGWGEAETRESPRAANDNPVSKSPWEWPAGRTRVTGNAKGTQCRCRAHHGTARPLRKGGASPPACCVLAVEASWAESPGNTACPLSEAPMWWRSWTTDATTTGESQTVRTTRELPRAQTRMAVRIQTRKQAGRQVVACAASAEMSWE